MDYRMEERTRHRSSSFQREFTGCDKMTRLDSVDRIIDKIKEKKVDDYITWKMEVEGEIREKIYAKRTTYN
tara:strand:+ start:607 stop:819 length:213 start_codon:yes stop_codon:yes gene_type:complete